METVYIYGLYDPRNNELRYIGKSYDPNKRYKGHLDEAKNNIEINPYKNRWIRKLLSDNLSPVLRIIEECSEHTWKERERFLINEFRKKKFRLTNIQDGGQGGLVKESRIKLSKKLRGKPKSNEHKKKLSEINKGKTLSDEIKAKISEKLKGENNPFYGKKHSQETIEKIINANLGTSKSIETKNKMSIARKGRKITEVTREKMRKFQRENNPFRGKHHTDESKRKIGEASKSRQRVVAYLITCAKRNNDFTLEKKLQDEYFSITGKYK